MGYGIFLERHNAGDEDIVINSDGSDVIVSGGEKFENAVEYFMQNTAANEAKFSEDEIVKENQISPVQFITTPDCTAPQLDFLMNSDHKEHVERCYWLFWLAKRAQEDQKLPYLLKIPKSGKPFLGGGNMIASVWAFRSLNVAFNELLKTSDDWWSDQSIFMPLWLWSVTQEGSISKRFILRRGLISLDYTERFFSVPTAPVPGNAPFIHFPGIALAWRELAKQLFQHLAWYRNFNKSNFTISDLGATEVYAINGKYLSLVYEEICADAFKAGDLFKEKKL